MSGWMLSLAAALARRLPASARWALYRNRRLAGLIRSGLNRAAPQGLSDIAVAAGALQGMRLRLDLHREKDYWLGTYEPELQAAVAELVRPGMIAYDVGANIGYISLLLARAAGDSGHVYAFEALPDNLVRLRVNLDLNGMHPRVTVVEAAVIDQFRPVRFLVAPSSGMGKVEGSAGRQGVAYQDAINVQGLSLDEFVYRDGNPAPQVIKMDIEGGEVLAVPGMQRILQDYHPLVFLELHGPEAARAAWDALSGAGYQICRMAPGFPVVSSLDDLDWKAYLVAIPLA